MNRLVCMTGSAADRGAADLYRQQAALFAERFPRRFLTRLEALAKDCERTGQLIQNGEQPAAGKKEAEDLPAFAGTAVPIEEGGLWAALWKLGESAQTGLTVDASAIPVRQEVVEICELLEMDPYSLPSTGTVFLCDPQAAFAAEETAVQCLLSAQEAAEDAQTRSPAFTVIGRTTDAAARIVCIGDRIRYLNRSAE